MASFTSARTLTAESSAIPSKNGVPLLVPIRLEGQEHLSELFEYRLELKTPESTDTSPSEAANINLPDMVGREITIKIELEGIGHFSPGSVGDTGTANQGSGSREINALITEAIYLRPEGRHHVYALTLNPWLHLSTLTTDCKIFQDKTIVQLLDDLLADYPFPVDKRLSATYPIRDYQVQYLETDYHFFARLCEEWGIAWWFEHTEGKHRLILADSPGAFKNNPSSAYQEVNWYPPGHKIDEEYLHTVNITDRLVSGSWASSDLDYTRHRADLTITHSDPRPTGHADQEIYAYPVDTAQPKAGQGGYSGEGNKPLDEGEYFARVRLDSMRMHGHRAHAQGNLRGMVPGCTFNLKKHPQDNANIEWLILGTTLTIEDIGEESQGTATTLSGEPIPSQKWQCKVTLTLQPSNEPYHPEQRHKKPTTHGPQRAVVTGPGDKEMWTDALGRVKVAFPWDRYHQNDETSSCWLRVSSPWAGNHYGGIQIPRIGHEVLVDFENGDPDRPIITGRVVNNTQLLPWQLPDNQSLSGFRSKELHGGKANHLILDDTEGQIQAQLSSDHALSQLNLGKITRIPNEKGRKDKRGEGFELRTDMHGVIRAQAGMLITTEGRPNADKYIKDMAETVERIKVAHEQQDTLATLAKEQDAQEQGDQDEVAQELKKQQDAIKGNGSANIESGEFPEFDTPHLVLSSPAGIATTTPQSTHIAAGKHIALSSTEHISLTSGKRLLISITQGIRTLVQSAGWKLVAMTGDVDIKALKDNIKLFAKLNITAHANKITLNAKDEIVLNGGGSSVTFNSGGIVHATGGQFLVHSANTSFTGPKSQNPPFPEPKKPGKGNLELFHKYIDRGRGIVSNYEVTDALGRVTKGTLDPNGFAAVTGLAPGPVSVKFGKDNTDPWLDSSNMTLPEWPKKELQLTNDDPLGGLSGSIVDQAKQMAGSLLSGKGGKLGAFSALGGASGLMGMGASLLQQSGLGSSLMSGVQGLVPEGLSGVVQGAMGALGQVGQMAGGLPGSLPMPGIVGGGFGGAIGAATDVAGLGSTESKPSSTSDPALFTSTTIAT